MARRTSLPWLDKRGLASRVAVLGPVRHVRSQTAWLRRAAMSIFGKEKRPVARGWPDPSTAGTAQRDAPAVSDRLSFFGAVSAPCPRIQPYTIQFLENCQELGSALLGELQINSGVRSRLVFGPDLSVTRNRHMVYC